MLTWDQLRPVVLGRIVDREVNAADLRDRLAAVGVSLSPLVFRGMLAALERAGLVAGRYESKAAGGNIVEGRLYRLTAAGEADLAAAGTLPPRVRDAA